MGRAGVAMAQAKAGAEAPRLESTPTTARKLRALIKASPPDSRPAEPTQ